MSESSGRPAPAQVGRLARLIDLAALVCLVAGVGMYVYAQQGMKALAAGRMRYAQLSGQEGGWNLTHWSNLLLTSRVGLGLASAGVVIGIAAFVHHLRARKPIATDEQADHP